jgi:bile acid-coenzyme A ligase
MALIALARMLSFWAEQEPSRVAVHHEADSITYADLDASSNRLARAYAELGVDRDDFVTIALPNSIEFFAACFATWKLGATPQPVSAKLPKFERDQIIEIGQPKLVVGVSDGEHAGRKTLPKRFEPPTSLSSAELPERVATSWKAMTSGGSTGRPKLIVATQPAAQDPDEPLLNFPMGGSVLIPGPLYHNGPFIFATGGLLKGNTVTVTTRFDAEETLRLIQAHRVHTLYTVPTMMQRIWNLPRATREKYDISSLAVLWHLAAPCPMWLKGAFIDWLGADVVWELYSSTEGQGMTVISGTEWLAHRGSVGRPVPTCEMRIVGEDGRDLPTGQVGEVFMRPKAGAGTTYRYVGAEAKAIPGGWESLGDMGRLDDNGYLYISDRQTDMILCGGANVYPAEVEAAIDAFPGVRSSAVIGLPHEDLGNVVHAIVDAPDGSVTQAVLIAHLETRLVRYKIPRTFEFVSEPLRDDAGKVRRKALRDERCRQPVTPAPV